MRQLAKNTLILVALVGAGFAAAPAGGATAAKVATGDYQAAPVLAADAEYSVGVFSVKRSAGKRQIVRSNQYAGIFYPDAGECDRFELPLTAASIPISVTGRFRIREKTPVEGGFVQVDWRGHWSRPGVVGGSITVQHEACTSTHEWSGGKVG